MFDVVIIGCGAIAGGYDADRIGLPPLSHAGAFSAHPDFRLAACVDPQTGRLASFMSRWNVETAAPTLAGLPADQRADVVVIASPTALHAAHVEAALGLAPRLVFCEKPVTASASQTADCVARCAAAGVLLAVNHTRRWAPDIVALAADLRSGRYGAIRSATGIYNKGALNNGSHMVDLLHMLFGEIAVVGAGAPVCDHQADDPSIPCLLSAGGVPVALNIGDARDYARFELDITTECAAIAMEDGGMTWRVRSVGANPEFPGYRRLGPGAGTPGRYAEAMTGAVANIHGALTEAAPLASDGASALAAQRVCEAIAAMAHRFQSGMQ